MLDFENLLTYTVAARLVEPTEKELEEVEPMIKAYHTAATPSPIASGKPRMLFINAWMVHEGRNLNGDAFVKEELERRVNEGLFSPPHAGMIDDDHDFTPRGFWYKTTFAFDESAKKWGIFAQGAVWAWRYTELADRLIAEMAREGKIMVSMATIPESVEITTHYAGFEGEYTRVNHNPVFLTTSTLSVPPGDPDARGMATEDPKVGIVNSENPEKTVSEDKQMDKEKELAEALEACAKMKKDKEETEERMKKAEADHTAELTALNAKLAEADVTIKSLTEAKASLEAKIADFDKKLAELQSKVDAVEAENKEKELTARFESRMAQVPDVVKKNLEKSSDKEAVISRWKGLPEDEWTIVAASLSVVSESSLTARSKEEGALPISGGLPADAKTNLKAYLKD